MSRIGKKPIAIPKNITVTIAGRLVSVAGPKGELKREIPSAVKVFQKDSFIYLEITRNDANALWGLSRALIANMVKGVDTGFEKGLEFNGVGYKAQVKGTDLELQLGFSHPVTVKALPGISFKVEKNSITVSGADKESVGHVAARIRSLRPPEPYQGTGVKYKDEIIRRKAGKKAASTA